jgi:hypothetical protein
MVWPCPKETPRGTSEVWGQSKYQWEERKREAEADLGRGNKKRFEKLGCTKGYVFGQEGLESSY